MSSVNRFFTSRWGVVATGLVIGVLAALMVKWGNPGNMGVCIACFSRDIAGALGLHRAAPAQYIRPEIIGFVLGSLVAALAFREFRPRTGSSPLARFILGMFAMVGALVFLGCSWRVFLRLGGGDWNALFGLLGLVAGIGVGVVFLRMGFSLGRNQPAPVALGWVVPLVMVGLLLLLVFMPQFGRDAEGAAIGPVFQTPSDVAPGGKHAAVWISLAAGLVIGFLGQRSRFCTVGAFRDLILLKDTHMLFGVVALLVGVFATNVALGQFHPGFAGQPVAHTDGLWNFLGMVLAGLAFTLAGGCPGRQVFLAGEGDADAGMFVFGLLAGAAFAHNFNLASSGKGIGPYGAEATILGLVVCIVIGLTMRDRAAA